MPSRPDIAERIRRLRSPRDALDEANKLRKLQRTDWFNVNLGIMDRILYAKFTQYPELKASLLGTGNSELIEDSPVRAGRVCAWGYADRVQVDDFWGCGRDRQGRNELGKALMRLRDILRPVY